MLHQHPNLMNLFLFLIIVLLILVLIPGALVILFKTVLVVGACVAVLTLFAVWLFDHLSK